MKPIFRSVVALTLATSAFQSRSHVEYVVPTIGK